MFFLVLTRNSMPGTNKYMEQHARFKQILGATCQVLQMHGAACQVLRKTRSRMPDTKKIQGAACQVITNTKQNNQPIPTNKISKE